MYPVGTIATHPEGCGTRQNGTRTPQCLIACLYHLGLDHFALTPSSTTAGKQVCWLPRGAGLAWSGVCEWFRVSWILDGPDVVESQNLEANGVPSSDASIRHKDNPWIDAHANKSYSTVDPYWP